MTDAFARPTEPIALDPPLHPDQIPTPALVIDVEAMERNLDQMSSFLGERAKGIRPHTKTHKCPTIARRQLDRGAVGICCAKVSEAEAMAGAGLQAILITSPVVSPDKAARVARLAAEAAVEIVIDSELGAAVLERAAAAAGVVVPVLIDLDVGTHRTGIAPGEPALGLAQHVGELAHLELRGLQAYAGHLMHVEGYEERRRRSHKALRAAIETRESFLREGLPCPVLTGGGTGTFDIDCDLPQMTDLQVGSYLFMDSEYRGIGGKPQLGADGSASSDGHVLETFEPSLFVLATAISRPKAGLVTVDAGAKAMVYEKTRPQLIDVEGVRYHWAGDEHGILDVGLASKAIELGDRLRILPAHCDPTVNLYDFYYPITGGLEGGLVRELWPITARGCSQ